MGLAYMVTAVECGTTEPVEWRIISGTCGAGSSILLRHSAQQDMKIISVSYFELGTFHSVRLNIKQSQYITNVCPSLRGLPSSDDKAEISRHDYPIYDKSSPPNQNRAIRNAPLQKSRYLPGASAFIGI